MMVRIYSNSSPSPNLKISEPSIPYYLVESKIFLLTLFHSNRVSDFPFDSEKIVISILLLFFFTIVLLASGFQMEPLSVSLFRFSPLNTNNTTNHTFTHAYIFKTK